jgi:uncharacterized protein (DUF1015 family)
MNIVVNNRKIYIENFYFGYTYINLLLGNPNREINEKIIAGIKPPSNWPYNSFVWAAIDNKQMDGKLPACYFHAVVSSSPINPDFCGSGFVFTWLDEYPENKTIDSIVNDIVNKQPALYDFTAEDGIQHTVWLIDNAETIAAITNTFQQEIPYTYIADGHHRTASAAKVGQQLKEQNAHHTGNEDYNFFLSVLFPANQLAIMDYNRVVKDLNGLTAEDFLSKVAKKFDIAESTLETVKPAALHQFGMYLNKKWYTLQSKPGTYSNDPIGILDVTILSENILDPLLGIKDQRTDKRIDFVGGIRGIKALQERVDSGAAAVAFALYAVSIQQLIDIADSGNVMPPKSTWFEPKLRDGLFSHLF